MRVQACVALVTGANRGLGAVVKIVSVLSRLALAGDPPVYIGTGA